MSVVVFFMVVTMARVLALLFVWPGSLFVHTVIVIDLPFHLCMRSRDFFLSSGFFSLAARVHRFCENPQH